MSNSIVIIPTYNEKSNIEKLASEITRRKFDLLIIDDNSPDGTGIIADRIAAGNNSVSVIHRSRKLGLGSAYIQGFNSLLGKEYGYIFTMDADLSHNPEHIDEMQEKLRGFDMVIGSRYVPGGGISGWPLTRRLLSAGGNLFARNFARIPINDLTSGFMGMRRKVIDGINFKEIKTEGYGFLIEVKFRAIRSGFTFCEIPITFLDRIAGKSKISRKIILEAFLLVFRLRFPIFGKEDKGVSKI